jgi:hypothetical protein
MSLGYFNGEEQCGNAPSNSPCLVGAGPLQVGQSRCANATVKCRGIETDNLGAIGFQHCDAQVTDCNGAVYSVSAGPVNNYMNSGQQAMNAWAVSPPTAPFTGKTVWQGNLTCTQSACLFETTQEWNQSVVKPLYHPVTGPNSNNFLWNTLEIGGHDTYSLRDITHQPAVASNCRE